MASDSDDEVRVVDHPAERRAATQAEKGKGIANAGASSSGGAGVVVFNKHGKPVKLNGPIEVTWSHGEPYPGPHWPGFKCYYCLKGKRGGGVSRLKEHLGHILGNVEPCRKVPDHVKNIMSQEVTDGRIRRARGKKLRLFVEKEVAARNGCGSARVPFGEEARIEMAMLNSLRDSSSTLEHGSCSPFGKSTGSGSGAASSTKKQCVLQSFYKSTQGPFDIDLARSRSQVQPRVDVMLEKGHKEKLALALAKWFHANDIPGRKADCPYFRSALKLAQQLGDGVPIPRGREIDGPLLDKNYAEMEANMAEFKEDWKDYGVTVMCDSWTGPTMMSIINFMIFCNGRMFFHKTVDATGSIQNSDYIYNIIAEVVVADIGIKNVVQIITDNGSNYKKACRELTTRYSNITWQPCAAHTINLMLKDIGRFPDVAEVVDSAKRICRFFYNHNRLHAMMQEKIGGELVRWNATRFGTVFIFLQSFWDKKDKFKLWMASEDWENCRWAGEEDHDFTYDCLTKKKWWSDMNKVLKAVSPIYSVLRLADQQKNVSISSFLPQMLSAMDEIKANLSDDPSHKILCDRVMKVINTRLDYMLSNTLMLAAAALNPKALYTTKIARKPKSQHAVTLAIKKLASSSSKASAAIDQYTFFRKQAGLFGGEEARKSALNGRLSAADWWDQYGGDYPELQEFARRIVSQCMSSSGCERNWSTFALVHTKLRNRLGYEKLHKLVSVHYNLKLRIQHFEADMESLEQLKASRDRDTDPCSIMIDVAMYDEGNPIMDWLCNSRSESMPTLDENDDSEPEAPNRPNGFILEELGGLNEEEMGLFKSSIGSGSKYGRKRKVVEEEDIGDDFLSDSSEGQGSPMYAESGDSDSNDGGGSEDGGPSGPSSAVCPTDVAVGANNGSAEDEQSVPPRPRSKRQKKLSVKGLYMLQK